MPIRLHYKTVTPLLREILNNVMANAIFDPFFLVGGTSLSLRLGHRISVDIDLFTNATYGCLNFTIFETFFQENYAYYYCTDQSNIVRFGRSYYIGESEEESIKIDLYYHDGLITPCDIIDNIRIANIEDVIAMKVEVISQGGRKKDFWDLHELLEHFSISQMLEIHQSRNEYTHERSKIITRFTDFASADEDIDPICIKAKSWELIKLDFVEAIENMTD